MSRRVALVLLLLAVGCSGSRTASFPVAAAAARPGGTLRVAITTPGSVDPGNDYEPAGDLVIRTMCDSLLTTDPRDASIRPGLAESWVVADGGAKLVLRLRKGLRFSDGSALTADDVAYSLSRIASADFASVEADRLALIAGYPQVHGDVETDSDTDRRRLSGVQATDPRTVEISLSRPYADFLHILTLGLTAPVSRHAAQADPRGFARSPVCAGPYRLAAPYLPGAGSLRLVRNTAYLPSQAGLTRGGASYADEVDFVVSTTPTADVDVRPATPADAAGVQTGPGPDVEYLGLPTQTAPFDKPLVRRALALAISRAELVRRVLPRTRVPAVGFVPATTGAPDSCDALPPNGNVAAAAAALRAAGVDLHGVRVPLLFNDEFHNRAIVAEVARQWRAALGLDAVPSAVPVPAFLAGGGPNHALTSPFRFSWAGAGRDDYLTPLFSTDAIGRDNFSQFSDPAVDDALTRRAWRAVDAADRSLAYRRTEALVCEQMPMVPLTTSVRRYVISSRIASASGHFVDASTGEPLLRELFLRTT